MKRLLRLQEQAEEEAAGGEGTEAERRSGKRSRKTQRNVKSVWKTDFINSDRDIDI